MSQHPAVAGWSVAYRASSLNRNSPLALSARRLPDYHHHSVPIFSKSGGFL
jgi:hypothetical protein